MQSIPCHEDEKATQNKADPIGYKDPGWSDNPINISSEVDSDSDGSGEHLRDRKRDLENPSVRSTSADHVEKVPQIHHVTQNPLGSSTCRSSKKVIIRAQLDIYASRSLKENPIYGTEFVDPTLPDVIASNSPNEPIAPSTPLSSEDPDPPVHFSRKRRNASGHASKENVSQAERQSGYSSSDSDAPLLPSWKKVKVPLKSIPLDVSGVGNSTPGQSLHLPSPSQPRSLQERVRKKSAYHLHGLSKNYLGGYVVDKRPIKKDGKLFWPIPNPETLEVPFMKQLWPIPSSIPAIRVSPPSKGDESIASETGSQESEGEESNAAFRTATTPITGKSSFGIKDIVGKDKPPGGHVFSLNDVVPKKRPEPVKNSVCKLHFQLFHSALRACFRPVDTGSDFIQYDPVKKKRKFTLADVTNTRPPERLFSVEYAVDQYKRYGFKCNIQEVQDAVGESQENRYTSHRVDMEKTSSGTNSDTLQTTLGRVFDEAEGMVTRRRKRTMLAQEDESTNDEDSRNSSQSI